MSLVEVSQLRIAFGTAAPVVDGLSFSLEAGGSLGLVGASGSGKSLTALALMGLLPAGAHVLGGSVLYDGRELLGLPEAQRRLLRGKDMGLVFQEPFTALNPLMRVGEQIAESLRLHLDLNPNEAKAEAVAALQRVGLSPGRERARQYPHQLSGGMRQRVLLAMALAAKPRLLIADEPTTALDATVQARVLDLLKRLHDELGFALLIISHDLGVIHALTPKVLVLEHGRMVEQGNLADVVRTPASGAMARMVAAYRTLL